jgi:hypothetical protein
MHGGVGEDQSTTGLRRLPVAEASEVLGITVEAVRRRIKRGTLEHERDSGPVFVLLGADHSDDQPRPDDDQTSDRLRSDSAALISEMRDRIESLERQLEQERQANSEHRRLLAAALERIPPQLEAPQEASEEAESVEEAPDRAEPRSSGGEVQEELDTARARCEMAETTMHKGMTEERRRREKAERERDQLRGE